MHASQQDDELKELLKNEIRHNRTQATHELINLAESSSLGNKAKYFSSECHHDLAKFLYDYNKAKNNITSKDQLPAEILAARFADRYLWCQFIATKQAHN